MSARSKQITIDEVADLPEIINVSQVKQLSPFRYPGGKTWFVPRFQSWISSLPTRPSLLVEPFAGGGIISLSTASLNLVEKCVMVEKDEDVAAVWKTIFYGNWQQLTERIMNLNLTVDSAQEILSAPTRSTEDLAFKTILRNRILHGGILAEGSGILKHGENGKGILSRWYPETLARRIQAISSMKDKIIFHEGDAFEYIQKYSDNDTAVFFVDPPYTASKKKAGRRLYRYSEIDHELLFEVLKEAKGNFMLTYDLDDNIIDLAQSHDFKYENILMTGTHNTVKYELAITRN